MQPAFDPRTRPTPRHVTTSDGCRIATWLDGPPGAPALVLSCSLGTTAEMWAPQTAALSTRFRVLRYDPRGHGLSDAPEGGYSIARLAGDVLDVLDAHELARVHVCGLSMGGMIGQWLGAHAPDRIDRLVLANTAAYMGPPAGWDERIGLVRHRGMSAIADAVVERWFTPAFRERSPAVVASVKEMLLATSPIGYAGSCAAIRDMDQRPTTARITSPTLVIAGALDPATPPSTATALAAELKAPKLVTLEAAHLSNLEQPESFTRAVLEHLS